MNSPLPATSLRIAEAAWVDLTPCRHTPRTPAVIEPVEIDGELIRRLETAPANPALDAALSERVALNAQFFARPSNPSPLGVMAHG